ncbi:hypothetical protein [Chryseobacterium sp. HSC-36S06]|uniref:hypothetical protein n=1 Tax=Chryseobacterium sp. HSC-36S06 TaxID=2910970 RepID=UPI00209FF22A|nr:hypothetical protein [Chryseobacterium sp. HSC-36S06]MCP2037329.1 hypothetical protein [Chryseobacterium sp. HSC-36S06]
MNKEYPLTPTKDDDISYLIWQELRMLNMGITNMEAKLDETNKKINEINHRLLSVYDFDSGINKLCDKLTTIEEKTKG